jgi:hypothetical protein
MRQADQALADLASGAFGGAAVLHVPDEWSDAS